MADRYHEVAKSTGAHVALAAGFCAVAAELGADMALEGVGGDATEAMALDGWLERYSGGVSAGVLNTPKNVTFPKPWATDPYVLAPNASAALKPDTLVEGMRFPAYVRHEGIVVPNLFGPYDARLVRRSFTQRGQNVTLRVASTPAQYAAWSEFLLAHPGSWGSLTTCPTEALLKGGYWRYRFVARRARTAAPAATVVLSGSGDPGYHFTAVSLAEVALCLAGVTGPTCKGAHAGVLSPGVAVNASSLRTRMEAIGLVKATVGAASEQAMTAQAPMASAEQQTQVAAVMDLLGSSQAHVDATSLEELLRQLRVAK